MEANSTWKLYTMRNSFLCRTDILISVRFLICIRFLLSYNHKSPDTHLQKEEQFIKQFSSQFLICITPAATFGLCLLLWRASQSQVPEDPLEDHFLSSIAFFESLSHCLNISQQKDLELNGINVNNIDCWALWSLLERTSTIILDLKRVWDHGPQVHYHTACSEPLLLAHNLKLWKVNLYGHAGKSPALYHPADQENSHSVSYPTREL
jgi:hypothetical protein